MNDDAKIVLVVTIAQAKCIAQHFPELTETVDIELRQAEALDGVPRTVLYRDLGDGLTQAAVCFYDSAAADRAAEALWQETLKSGRTRELEQTTLFGDQ